MSFIVIIVYLWIRNVLKTYFRLLIIGDDPLEAAHR